MENNTETAAYMLTQYITRIEKIEEEQKELADCKTEVYAEAASNGFDKATIREVIKLRKKDESERLEQDAILTTYLLALGMISDV